MKLAERRIRQVNTSDNVSVISNAILLARRIRDLQRRRQDLVTRQDHLRTQLPDWAVEPLRLVGMTSDEVSGLLDDLTSVEADAGLDDIDQELEKIDQQAEEIENLLVNTPSASLEEVQSVMGLVIARFREVFVTDPDDVFYDHGEARLLALAERVYEDLTDLVQGPTLNVG
jgi:hypothetical protein